MSRSNTLNTQNDLLMSSLMDFYNSRDNLNKMIHIINGKSDISLRIVDWFVTNYAKKYYTVYEQSGGTENMQTISRFKVYNDYKLKLKAYSKKRFDPFCRWDRVSIPYDKEQCVETTIGQLNFFKWAIENRVLDYIFAHLKEIELDMNTNIRPGKEKKKGSGKKKTVKAPKAGGGTETDTVNADETTGGGSVSKKKRRELSTNATKTINKHKFTVVLDFD